MDSIRCKTCDGVAHPATGCVYSPTFIVCGPCTRQAWAWVVRHTAGKGRRRGPSFYDHVNRVAAPLAVSASGRVDGGKGDGRSQRRRERARPDPELVTDMRECTGEGWAFAADPYGLDLLDSADEGP